jgi:AcrR family transcriptional regulator
LLGREGTRSISVKKGTRRDGGATNRTNGLAQPREPRWEFNTKALQTKQLILDAARDLFLERGYSGTRIEHITSACGLSRGAFYAYFTSKLEVFETLGTSTYKSQVAVVARLAELPQPCKPADVRAWAEDYFAFMAEHGAFMLSSAHGGPQEADFQARVRTLTVRTAKRLGHQFQLQSGRMDGSDVALGLAAMSVLERSWFFVNGMGLAVTIDDVLDAVTDTLYGLLEPSRSARGHD